MADANNGSPKTRLWDLPTRLFHILIIGLVGYSWYTSENMHVFAFGPQTGLSMFDLHVWSGIALLTVILFRILWGLFGSTTARFSHFVKGPGAVWQYLNTKTDSPSNFGHNPVGGWSVVLFLAILIVQPALGLLSSEDTFGLEGPLKHLVSTKNSYWLAGIHDILFNVLLAVIGLHLCAVLFYQLVKKDNLIGPMISGRTKKSAPEELKFQPLWRAMIVLAIAGLIVWSALTLLAK